MISISTPKSKDLNRVCIITLREIMNKNYNSFNIKKTLFCNKIYYSNLEKIHLFKVILQKSLAGIIR